MLTLLCLALQTTMVVIPTETHSLCLVQKTSTEVLKLSLDIHVHDNLCFICRGDFKQFMYFFK